jgi:hypothetical protein
MYLNVLVMPRNCVDFCLFCLCVLFPALLVDPRLLLRLPYFRIHNLGLALLRPHFGLNPSRRRNRIIVHFV